VKAVTLSHSSEINTHAEAIDEFFRKSFRKITARQAFEILEPLGQDTTEKAACLDNSFWTWETLEEAIRGNLHEFNDAEFLTLLRAFGGNYKGSREFLDLIENRVYMKQGL
jgi:hypothetical protein